MTQKHTAKVGTGKANGNVIVSVVTAVTKELVRPVGRRLYGLILLTAVAALSVTPAGAWAKVVYVSTVGNDANDGLSWAAAKLTVTAGLTTAESGDQVWVAAGTYVGMHGLKNGVALYGGFAGDETELMQRDWKNNVTILDGNYTNVVVAITSGTSTNTRIDGFTIRRGNYVYSGGIYCWQSSLTIVNNTFTENIGGAIGCFGSSSVIANNVIVGNDNFGIGCMQSSSTVITNNTITGNDIGIFDDSTSSPTIRNSIVAFNTYGIQRSTYSSGSGTPTLRNNDVFGNALNYPGLTAGVGDISVDPKLVAAGYGQVHLRADSPCMDAGDDSAVETGWLDIDGQFRVQGSHVDIGADEYDGTPPPAYQPAVVRVSPSGNDSNDGSSWALTKRTVQAGIDAAYAVHGDVWVAAGTYNERIILKCFVHVYGGFAGTEAVRDGRNWTTNAAILDGGAGGTVVSAKNCGAFISTVDGFTIRNGSSAGITCESSSPMIANNTIKGNSIGGISCLYASPRITNNTIMENGNSDTSSGISCGSSPALITGNVISRNVGNGIRGIDSSTNTNPPPVIMNNMIAGNRAAGISCNNTSVVISNNVIAGNSASGVDCMISDSRTKAIMVIAGNTITGNNRSYNGGGISCSLSSSLSTARIVNNVAVFNASGIYVSGTSSSFALRNNDVYGNTANNFMPIDPIGTNGNISANPRFVRGANPGADGTWGTADDDYGDLRLMFGSPCIDAGSNADVPAGVVTDVAGNPRFVDDPARPDTGSGTAPIVDIGAYEGTYSDPVAADFNADGQVDALDFDTFSGCYTGPADFITGDCAKVDLNGDQHVDATDFDVFSSCYNGPTNPPRCR